MKKDLLLLTKEDLRHLGFSKYLIQEVCKGLDIVSLESGMRGYSQIALREAIANKLSENKIKPHTRENLQVALTLIDDKSNVIEVDFLRKLSLEERINFLKDYREKLRVKGQVILQDIDELLKRAKSLT